ncbi:MAG: PAS domain-containing protein [Thalassobaculaceae bacterium]
MGVDATELGRPELKELFGFWRQARRGDAVPVLGSVSPVDVAPYLSQIVMVEIEHPDDRVRFLQVGRALTPVLGDDLEGRYLDTLPRGLRVNVEETYRTMLAERAPQHAEFEIAGDDWVVLFERLMLPFRAARTDRIAGAMVAIYPRISITKRAPVSGSEVGARDAVVAA